MQTPTGTTPEQLADLFGRFMVSSSMRSAQSQVFRVVEELELSMTQLKLLHLVDGADRELTPTELASFVGLSPAATGRAVDALVRSGLLLRRDDAEDRRVKRVTLTDTGRDAVGRLHQARLAALVDVLSELDRDQRDALAAALRPLIPEDSPSIPACGVPTPRDS